MNRLTVMLAATTVASLVATLHYALAWEQQRVRNEALSHSVTAERSQPAGPQPSQSDAAINTASVPAGTASPLPSDDAAIRVVGVGRDPVSLAVARHRLAELRDPQGRAQRAKEFMALLMFGGWETLAPKIGLPDEESARYLEARAQRILQRQERLLECQLDPTCDSKTLRASLDAANRQDEADLLGPEWFARLKAFQASSSERAFAAQLNRRLSGDDVLSDDRIDKLALALAEERQRLESQLRQNGLRGIGRVSNDFLLLYAVAVRGSPDEYAQLRESASEYDRRLISRAATMLTASQLAQFKATLDAELAIYLASLTNDEMEDAIRKAALSAVASQ